jgi:predicted ester cyclase
MTRKQIIHTAFLFLSVAAVSACSSPQPAAPAADQKAAEKPVTDQDRVMWYQDCWNDFNQHKWDDFKKCYADNAKSQQYGYGKVDATGPDAIVASSQDFAKSFPDGRGEPQIILINGSKIAGIYLLKGTNSGPLTSPDGKEMPATNKKFGLLFGHYIETGPAAGGESVQGAIRSLRVVKELGAMDGGTLASQLGLSKNPARPVMDTGQPMPRIVIAKNDDTEMKNLETDKMQIEAFNKHDNAAVDSFVAEDYVFHDATSPKDQNKKEGSDANLAFMKGFSDAKLTPTSIWPAGDYVVIIGVFDGTNDGPFPPVGIKQKTGKKVSLPYFGLDRFEGGKFKESWLIFDTAAFAAQLGLK